MKKKKNIFGIICGFAIGTIISSLTATYAATTLSSKNVYYDNTNSGGSSSNVAGAIDELYATDTTLVGYKDGGNVVNYTDGSKTVKLTSANLPKHTHDVTANGSVTSSFNGSEVVTSENGDHKHISYYFTGNSSFTESVPNGNIAFNYNATVFKNLNMSAITGNSASFPTNSKGAHTHTVKAEGTVTSTFTGTKVTSSSTGYDSSNITAVNVQNPYTIVYMYKRIS